MISFHDFLTLTSPPTTPSLPGLHTFVAGLRRRGNNDGESWDSSYAEVARRKGTGLWKTCGNDLPINQYAHFQFSLLTII